MNATDLAKEVARQIVEYGVPLDWKVYIVMFLFLIVFTAVNAYIVSRSSKAAEIDIMKKRLDDVLEQTRHIT
jgi:hypothetical protein